MRYTVLLIGAVGASTALMTAPTTIGAQDTTRTREEARGEVSRVRVDNRGLAREQVERLQERLNEMGCDAGPVDGLIGPRTRQAISCARTRENIPGNDIQELFQAAALFHDDVMDDSDTRRGRPAAHRAFGALHAERQWSGDA